jgi:hypothetical protein
MIYALIIDITYFNPMRTDRSDGWRRPIIATTLGEFEAILYRHVNHETKGRTQLDHHNIERSTANYRIVYDKIFHAI